MSRIGRVIEEDHAQLLSDWLGSLEQTGSQRRSMISQGELRQQCEEFLGLIGTAMAVDVDDTDVDGPRWRGVRDFLEDVSRSRGRQGFSPSETARFVFSFKAVLTERLRKSTTDLEGLLADVTLVSSVIDRLGLFTTEVHQRAREEVIVRQQEEMLELSTPVVRLWEGVLALPMIGTLDSGRTQVVMEALLQRLVEERAPIAILDITGVPTVDTLTAQHLLKTVAAAKLMGAECIISGIRPQIAQTIVHLGVDLGDVTTKATLADAFALALRRMGKRVTDRA